MLLSCCKASFGHRLWLSWDVMVIARSWHSWDTVFFHNWSSFLSHWTTELRLLIIRGKVRVRASLNIFQNFSSWLTDLSSIKIGTLLIVIGFVLNISRILRECQLARLHDWFRTAFYEHLVICGSRQLVDRVAIHAAESHGTFHEQVFWDLAGASPALCIGCIFGIMIEIYLFMRLCVHIDRHWIWSLTIHKTWLGWSLWSLQWLDLWRCNFAFLLFKKNCSQFFCCHTVVSIFLWPTLLLLRAESVHQAQYYDAWDEIHSESGEIHILVESIPVVEIFFRMILMLHWKDYCIKLEANRGHKVQDYYKRCCKVVQASLSSRYFNLRLTQ